MTPQEQMAQVVKLLRTHAKDNLAVADYLDGLTITEPTVPTEESPSTPIS